jgi:DNA polymerase alpha subunit B
MEMTITPLVDLLVEVRNNQPDVLILLGPFIDADAEVVAFTTDNIQMAGGRAEELFAGMLLEIHDQLKDQATHVVVVPSTRDLHHVCQRAGYTCAGGCPF